MIEDAIDLWETPCDARCITTNGTVKSNGRAVMGRGCAKQATERIPFIQLALGTRIRLEGLHTYTIGHYGGVPLLCFPVKHSWDMRADLDLITQSAIELAALADIQPWKVILLPRPGCGNGQRKWHEVKPILAPLLDDRFVVVTL